MNKTAFRLMHLHWKIITNIIKKRLSIMKKKLKEGMTEQQFSRNCKNSLINLKLKFSKIIQTKKFQNLPIGKIQFPNLHKEYKTNIIILNLLVNNYKLMIKIKRSLYKMNKN